MKQECKHRWHFMVSITNPYYRPAKHRGCIQFGCDKCGEIKFVKGKKNDTRT